MSKSDFSGPLAASVAIKVPFFDLDSAGVVWHGRYFQYFELARCKLLEGLNYSYREMEASGLLWPVADTSVRYLRPLVLDQQATVSACLREWELRIVVDYRIVDTDGQLTTRASTMQVPVLADTLALTLGAPQNFIDAVNARLATRQ
jgi:acyl-CoA thioester hydrolase